MKNLSHSFAIIACVIGSAYFIGCGSDADSDDDNTAGSGGEAGNGDGQAGSNNAGSGGSSGSGGTANTGGSGGSVGGTGGTGGSVGGNGGTGGSDGGNGGTGGSDEGGAGGEDNQGGGGAGGSGGEGNPPSAGCEELCIGNADSDSIFTMCPEFTTGAQGYFGGSEATCLSECAANENGPWNMDCRLMHLETIYNQGSFNDGVHCPHVNGAAPCQDTQ